MLSAIRQFKRFLRVNVADLRKGDWIELDNGRVVIVNNLVSSHSGRGSRSFLVRRVLDFAGSLTFSLATLAYGNGC